VDVLASESVLLVDELLAVEEAELGSVVELLVGNKVPMDDIFNFS
jgi:hypothetical protein